MKLHLDVRTLNVYSAQRFVVRSYLHYLLRYRNDAFRIVHPKTAQCKSPRDGSDTSTTQLTQEEDVEQSLDIQSKQYARK